MKLSRALLWLTLATAAAPIARAGDVTLNDVSLSTEAMILRAPRVDLVDTPLSRDEAMALLAPADAATAVARLASLKAKRISIPELSVETRAGGQTQTIVYRDLVLADVDKGRAERIDSPSARFASQRAKGAMNGQCGVLQARGVDFAAIGRVMGQGRAGGGAAQTSVQDFVIDDCAFDAEDGVAITFGRLQGKAFGGRPLLAPLGSLIQPPGAPPPDARAARIAVGRLAADMFDSLAFGAIEFTNLRTTARPPAKPFDLAIKTFRLEAMKDSRIGLLSLEGLTMAIPDGAFALGKGSLTGFDLKPVFAASFAEPAKSAVPRFDGIEIADLARPGLSIGRATIAAARWFNLLPGVLSAEVERAKITPAILGAPALAALGYTTIESGGAFRMRYDADKRSLHFEDLSSRAPEFGAARMSADFAKVGPEAFSGDLEAAKAAIPAIMFAGAALRLEDLGLFARLASKPGVAPSRADLALSARLILRGMLGDAPAMAPAIEAVGRFFESGKTLDLRISAPQPIGLIDLMMAGRLSALADKLTIEAKTQ